MGSYNRAENVELVGIDVLSHLSTITHKNNCGLYRYDDLLVLRNVNGQHIDRTRKNVIQLFKYIDFLIDSKLI